MIRKTLQIFVLLCITTILQAQANMGFNQVPVHNFTRNEYKSGNQNWSIAQDKTGVVYFGNNNGLLVYNGNTWKLCPLPNLTTVRSVATDQSGRIYVGSFEEFGYFKADEFGVLHYFSLSALLKNYDFHNEEIWKIIIHDDAVYFQSFTVVFKYSHNKIETLIPGGFISCFTKIRNRLILNINPNGLVEIKGNRFVSISKENFFKNHQITAILNLNEKEWLIATLQDGMVFYNSNGEISEWKTALQKELIQNQVNRGLITSDGKIILGTILNGVYLFDRQGNLLHHIDKKNGLQNNTVLDLYCDLNGDVWAGLDSGIDLLVLNSNISFFYDFSGNIGSVYALQLRSGILYIGTNQGLYSSQVPENSKGTIVPEFKLLSNSQGQVWSIYDDGNQILCGHNKGSFEVQGNRLMPVSDISGGFSFEPMIHKGKEYLLGSTYTKLVVYEKKAGKWKFRNTIEGFMHPIKQIRIDYMGNIWASHFVKGLFRLNLNDSLTRVENVVNYGKTKGFNSDYQINVSRLQNRIVFINQGKIFTYNDILDSIIPYPTLEKQLGMQLYIRNIMQADSRHSWIIADQGILKVSLVNEKWQSDKKYPSDMFYNKVISGQEFILPLNNGDAILALDNGLAYINSDTVNIPESLIIKPLFSKIFSAGDSETQFPLYQEKGKIPSIPYSGNNLVFQCSYPQYRGSDFFLVKLIGIDEKWIRTDLAEIKYDRIPPGSYTLVIKAVANGLESDTIQWTFIINDPWYLNKFAKVFYLLVLVALASYIRYYYKKRLTIQTRRLKIEKERELIRLRNEKLEAEISHKTKDLANTTLSIIKKNELLLEIRKLLMLQKRQAPSGQTPRLAGIVKLLDRNISNEDDWRIFESNFEQAHEEFLKRIREKFPDLTPSDLKLCAYLRMNLSSKKIALLLGITIRGVENHRYRLRKKMGLEHDSNLIDYLMKF